MGELCLLGICEDPPGVPRSGVQETGWHMLTHLKYPLYNIMMLMSLDYPSCSCVCMGVLVCGTHSSII